MEAGGTPKVCHTEEQKREFLEEGEASLSVRHEKDGSYQSVDLTKQRPPGSLIRAASQPGGNRSQSDWK